MKTTITNLLTQRVVAIAMSLAMFAAPVLAQSGSTAVKTNTKILYHDGPVMQGGSNVYTIWYGNWIGSLATTIVTDFLANLGSSPYHKINIAYPDLNGGRSNGVVIFSGTVNDAYSKGAELSALDIQSIISDQLTAGRLPLDAAGIFVVLGSPDVSSIATGFCQLNGPPPHHGYFIHLGVQIKYAFIGNPARCPATAAPQLPFPGPTPNGDFAADGIVNNLAAAISATITNPTGSSWFDRYGLENSTKCKGIFGPTYTVPNGAQANVHMGTRDYLLQQNWVNSTRKGYCAMAAPTP